MGIALTNAHVRSLCERQDAISDAPEGSAIEAALYRFPAVGSDPDTALAARFAAIREAFAYHYSHNAYYRNLCRAAGFALADLKGVGDLARVPLVPETAFKGCSDSGEFLAWLRHMSSDEIPWPAPGSLTGGYDAQIETLWTQHRVKVRSTSGSSGVPSFLPRDETTRRRSAHWKILAFFDMYPELVAKGDRRSVTLWPLDFSWADLMVPPDRVYALLDKKLGIERVVRAMSAPRPSGILSRLIGAGKRSEGHHLLTQLAERLGEVAAQGHGGLLWTPPFILYALALHCRDEGIHLHLDQDWRILLGGGWKLLHERPLSASELRGLAESVFGVPAGQVNDIYGSTECLGLCGMSCEGGYLHVPHSVLHPMVLGPDGRPAAEGEWGRFAYLNPLINAYPGFISTGDRVRMWSKCPACTRPGPVLDGEITRMPEAEERGCVNIIGDLVEENLRRHGQA